MDKLMRVLELAKRAGQGLMVVAVLLVGVVVLRRAVLDRKPPDRKTEGAPPRAVRVVEARKVAVRPWVRSYGVVAPQKVWRGVSEVNARIVGTHERLRDGALVDEGALLVSLDTTELTLVKQQTQAQIAQLKAQRKRLDIQEANDRTKLEIEKRGLALAEVELERQRKLLAKKTVPQRSVDSAEQSMLASRAKVLGLESSLAVLPAQKEELDASLAVQVARKAQTELDLKKTQIRAPFRGRLRQVEVEEGQFVRAGEVLFAIEGIAVAEVSARVSIDRLRPLMTVLDTTDGPAARLSIVKRLESRRTNLEVTVRLRVDPEVYEWKGRFDRAEGGLDPKTRTLGMIVAVDEPYRDVVDGKPRPPLAKGMFVEVVMRTRKSAELVVVPRSAIHQGVVRMVGKDDTLELVPVQLNFLLDRVAVLRGGVAPGSRVLATDLVPALVGMALAPETDEALTRELAELLEKGPDADVAGPSGR